MQNANQRTWQQVEQLHQKRRQGLRILDGIEWLVPQLRRLGCEVHIEQPQGADSWRTRPLARLREEMLEANTHGCAWGLRNSWGGMIYKPWRFLTTDPELRNLLDGKRCDRRHVHYPLEGSETTRSSSYPQCLVRAMAKLWMQP